WREERFRCAPSTTRSFSVKRDLLCIQTILIAVACVALPMSEAQASLAQDAKKVCLERYNAEKEGGTLPDGMSKSKYMSQCTRSFVRNAQLEAKEAATHDNQGSKPGQGGQSTGSQSGKNTTGQSSPN